MRSLAVFYSSSLRFLPGRTLTEDELGYIKICLVNVVSLHSRIWPWKKIFSCKYLAKRPLLYRLSYFCMWIREAGFYLAKLC